MNLPRETDSGPVVEYICPVSGLPVYSRPEWIDVYFDREKSDYAISVRIIGRNIILGKVSGNSTRRRLEKALRLLGTIITEEMAGRPFVYIDDFTEFKSATFEARRLYIDFLLNLKNLHALVLYTTSPLLELSLNLARRLFRPTFKTVVVSCYPDAVEYALGEMLPERDGGGASPSRASVPVIRIPDDGGRRDGLRQYTDELLLYLAGIDWQGKGMVPALQDRESGHPFKAVFDAIAYIKMDIDELFDEQLRVQKALEEREAHIQALTQELIKAQENERRRISRDLHDNVAQDLASLMISSETLFDGYPDIPVPVREKKERFGQVLKRVIRFIRDMAYDLRPSCLDQLGLVPTLSKYCNDFAGTHGFSVDFYSGGVEHLQFDFDTDINLYRLVQEALSNIRRHAGASHVTVRLTASHPSLLLRIEDNGRGFDVAARKPEALKEKRMGLKSMEERARLLSGTFAIRSTPGHGTRILVEIPHK